MEFRRSDVVTLRVKVHLLNKGYMWVPKMWDFAKNPNEEVSGNQRFWVWEASHPCYYDIRGRDSTYSGFNSHFWLIFGLKMVERVKELFG